MAVARRVGFTIIEMLVVLVIIGILAGIVITVGQRVSQGGKQAASKNAVEIADSLLTEYMASTEKPPPKFLITNRTQMTTTGTDDVLAPETYVFPIVDGRLEGRQVPNIGSAPVRFDKDLDPAEPSCALVLLAMASESSSVERQLKGVDARFVQLRDVFAHGWLVDANGFPTGQPVRRRLRVPVLVDAFGNPLRYVHPLFQGGYGDYYDNAEPAQRVSRRLLHVTVGNESASAPAASYNRSYRPFPNSMAKNFVGDADEGIAVGASGFFYSGGADGDPGTRSDNVYTKQPTYPTETARLN